jgi:nucleoside-triphosphatase
LEEALGNKSHILAFANAPWARGVSLYIVVGIRESMTQPPSAPPRILLTGRPGCGKTTVIQRAVELIGSDRCAGFYTEEVREKGRRVGFDVVTLDGRRGPLARAGARGPKVSRYGVDLASFEELGVETLERALEAGARVLIVDEIGKMELFSERFTALVDRLLGPSSDRAVLGTDRLLGPSSDRAVLGTVLAGRHPKVDRLRHLQGLQIIEVGPANRDGLPLELGRTYREFLDAGG